MSSDAVGRFGDLCVAAGFISRERLDEVLVTLAAENDGALTRRALGETLVRRGLVTAIQVREILALQKKELLACSACGKRFVVKQYDGSKSYRCKACGHAPLSPVERAADIAFHAEVGASAIWPAINPGQHRPPPEPPPPDDAAPASEPPAVPGGGEKPEPPPVTLFRVGGAAGRGASATAGGGGSSVIARLTRETGQPPADVTLGGGDEPRVAQMLSAGSGDERYVIDEEIGRGGMGQVLSAVDRDVRRQVAMKLMLGGDEAALRRFLQEAQVTGQLEHPNIVPLHEIGVSPEGRVFFTMKMVKGDDLAAIVRRAFTGDHRFTLSRLVEMYLKVCDAIAFAHSKGVIHRDLKPANIMVGGFGEVLVMDWGLAKVIGQGDPAAEEVVRTIASEEGLSASIDGDIVGTPSYMPPEQADEERAADLDERADVYSLGAILYEVLCGRPPFVGDDVWHIISQVRQGDIAPPEAHASRMGRGARG
ncbi:MAG: protein kinase, partial [Planctomycetes bacterium]|nr:protein kinase [Planctomycetota bacterium]